VQKLDHYSVLLCVPRHKAESSRECFSGGLEMAGALIFGAVCGFIVALIFAPVLSTDEKDQIEKAQKEQKEQLEKAQKDQKEQIEKEQKERKEKIEKKQEEKSTNKGNFKKRDKSEQTDKSWLAAVSKNEVSFCIKNCPDVWRLHRE
jgi:mannitol-specific phosphotransferase system IIBC component